MTGIIYRNSTVYRLTMQLLYRGRLDSRFRSISEVIPVGASVLELCCGPALLYRRYLKAKNVGYLGVDINAGFIEELRHHGGEGIVSKIEDLDPLPCADYIVMQSGLYHFLPDASGVVKRMLESARRATIIAEPVRNLANSRNIWISSIAGRLTDPGYGPCRDRFDEASFDALLRPHARDIVHESFIGGGREKMCVLQSR